MIDALITGLSKGLELSAEEIADTLWLALQIEESQPELSVRAGLRENSPQTTLKQGEPEVLPIEIPTHPSEPEETELNQPSDEPKAGVYPRNPQESLVGSGLSLRVPDAPSLREPLTLARALKPLMRRMPSGSTLVLDEAATTQQIAETGLWLPVLKPTLEPWLDLELVVDEGISMQIWRHTIGELERLLKNYGIFRDVRVWGLIADDREASDLPRIVQIRRGIGATAKNQSPRSPAELIDPSGRRLMLVVSDCVSPQWRDGKLTKTFELWAKQGSMAIVQMLPKWLWKRTALGRASEVRLQGLNPGEFNQKLIAKGVSLWDELEETRGVKVPIFTLEPDRVATWAQMLSGKGSTWTAGYVFKLDPIPARQGKDLFDLDVDRSSAEQRVQAFRVTASPMARKLAGFLAAAPVISLPIVRLIQETLLKESQQVHVAEVFLGGLLKPLSEINPETNPNYVQYEFMDGVRELLADSVPSGYVLDVVDAVSKYVARKLGLSLEEFAAVLRNPQQPIDNELVDQISYFATITAQILKGLGGKYRKFAEELELHNFDFRQEKTSSTLRLPVIHNLPNYYHSQFVGRENEIVRLMQMISPDVRQYITVIQGMGGIGKTSLALETAYRCIAEAESVEQISNVPAFDAIIFTSSKISNWMDNNVLKTPQKETTLTDIFRVINDTLSEPIITQLSEKELENQVRKVLARQSTLLIVDNIESLSKEQKHKVLSFLNNVPVTTQVIITSREWLGFHSIELSQLTHLDSIKLINSQAESKEITITNDDVSQIYKRFDGIPIAMIYAVGEIAAGYTFADILKTSELDLEQLGKFCFDSSVIPLRETAAHKLLMAITFFREPPCEDAVIKVAGFSSKNQNVVDGLVQLQQLCLIIRESERYVIQSFVREYALNELNEYVDDDIQAAMTHRWLNWYLNFTMQYGGKDWENWKLQYERLNIEWSNIESVLNWHESHQQWDKFLEIWEQVDSYIDLTGNWGKRIACWNTIQQNVDDVNVQVKALSEKAWTLILMGEEHHQEAEQSLKESWNIRENTSLPVRSDIAKYLAVLEKVRGHHDRSLAWLDRESEILTVAQLPEREKFRQEAQNLYYRSEINYLTGELDLAQEQIQRVIKLCEQIKWQRFNNYAQNQLADILIHTERLEQAEKLLMVGIAFAEAMKETRRIALYQVSYARLYYKLALKERASYSSNFNDSIAKAKDYACTAIPVLDKEHIGIEKMEMQQLLLDVAALETKSPRKTKQLDPSKAIEISKSIAVLNNSRSNDKEKMAALRVLRREGNDNDRAIRAIVSLILRPKESIAAISKAIEVLSKIGKDNSSVVPAILRILTPSQTRDVIISAIQAFAKIAVDNSNVIQKMLSLLSTSNDANVKKAIIESLGEVAVGHKIAISRLLAILRSTQNTSTIKIAASQSLGKVASLEDRDVISYMEIALKTEKYISVKKSIAISLNKIAPGNEAAAEYRRAEARKTKIRRK